MVDQLPVDTKVKRFTPVSMARTPYYVEEFISRYLMSTPNQS